MTGDYQEFDKNELVTVYTVSTPVEAEILKNFLNAEGIACEVGGEGQAGFTGITEIEILVKAIDADRAAALIRSHENRGDDESDD